MLNTQVKGNEAVVSQVYADIFKVKAGDTIRVKLENNFIVERRIREVINSLGGPTVFLDLTSLSENEKNALNPMSAILFNKQANAPKVTQNHLEKIFAQFNSDNKNNEINQEEIVVTASAALENNLNTAGFSVSNGRNRVELKEALIDHMQLIASFLLIMSFLTLFIGGLTIISSVSLSIMERRREIGILRSTGAPGKRITHLFILENWVIGFITFVLASVLAVPISELAGSTFGMIFLKMPLTPAIADHAVLLWFALTFLLTMIFSMIPARNAINSKLGSLLSYE
jgi:ABC-type antimicrobial peptide transport system permease subunit